MLVILDNGHGGIVKGTPVTPERRSEVFSDGKQLIEGEFNRAIVNGIIQELTFMRIPYFHISPELDFTDNIERYKRANTAAQGESDCFLVSVHSNYNEGPIAADGSEFWCYQHSTLGPSIATIFAEEFEAAFPDEKLRVFPDTGEKFKRNNGWYILKRTSMPAVLTENFFFNNVRETREILLTREGRNKIIDHHVSAIVRVFVEVYGIDTW